MLTPGQLLYMPAGFPHTTDTLDCALENEPSVHLTLGVDTHIWGLDGLGARAGALALLGEDDALAGREATAADADFYWSKLRKTLPALGWRGAPQASDADLGAIAAFLASTDARLAADGGRHCRAAAAPSASPRPLRLLRHKLDNPKHCVVAQLPEQARF